MQKGGEPATQAQIIEVIAASAAAAAFAKALGFDGVGTTALMAACSKCS
jgi:2,4-dienoyl-CoA reductase-like NADH-dependent reductase (Old Yellow Enzyme family)